MQPGYCGQCGEPMKRYDHTTHPGVIEPGTVILICHDCFEKRRIRLLPDPFNENLDRRFTAFTVPNRI